MELYPIQKLIQEQKKKYPHKFSAFFSQVGKSSPAKHTNHGVQKQKSFNLALNQDSTLKKTQSSMNNLDKSRNISGDAHTPISILKLGRKSRSNLSFHGSNMNDGIKNQNSPFLPGVNSTREHMHIEDSTVTHGGLQGLQSSGFSHRVIKPSKLKDISMNSASRLFGNTSEFTTIESQSALPNPGTGHVSRKSQMLSNKKKEPESAPAKTGEELGGTDQDVLSRLEKIYYRDLNEGKELGLIKLEDDKILTSPYKTKSKKKLIMTKEDVKIDSLLRSYRDAKNEKIEFEKNFNPYRGRDLSLEEKDRNKLKDSKLYKLEAKADILRNIKILDAEIKLNQQADNGESQREAQLPSVKLPSMTTRARKEFRISQIYQSQRG